MKLTYESFSTEKTEEIGKSLASLLDENKITNAFIAMRGEMGAGKTAFTRGFASHFGIFSVKSPTYTLVNEYLGKAKIYHLDLCRICGEDDLISIGFDDIVESGGFCIAEWSENIENFLPENFITVEIERDFSKELQDSDTVGDTIKRKISITIPEGVLKIDNSCP